MVVLDPPPPPHISIFKSMEKYDAKLLLSSSIIYTDAIEIGTEQRHTKVHQRKTKNMKFFVGIFNATVV